MSKLTKAEIQEIEDNMDEEDLDVDDEDYGFLIDKDGNLKTMFLPDHLDDHSQVPVSVKKIMRIFKIQDINQITTGGVLH